MPKKIFILNLIISLLVIHPPSFADKALCKQIVNYTMEIRLHPEKNLITGTELLSWMNDSESSIDELWFHLYWNAFQNNMSSFLREAGWRGKRASDFKKDDWGYCRVENIKIVKNPFFEDYDLTPTMEFRRPDDDNLYDQSVFSVKLPQPLDRGMEYPTLFTGGAYFITRKGIPRPEGITIHELGHGYFYGLVGRNEFENPWTDEGFTSFLDTEIYYAAYG